MKFAIHFTLSDGSEDTVIIEGDNDEELRQKAAEALAIRNISETDGYWSEEVT